MTPAEIVPAEDHAAAERWRQWQVRNAVTSRKDANRARIACAVLFAGVFAWLAIQLLA